jgi:hypothetical protein
VNIDKNYENRVGTFIRSIVCKFTLNYPEVKIIDGKDGSMPELLDTLFQEGADTPIIRKISLLRLHVSTRYN